LNLPQALAPAQFAKWGGAVIFFYQILLVLGANQMHALGHEAERAAVEAVLESGLLSRAPGMAQILSYVCDQYFQGQANTIKEYNIAVEALGRPADFDQRKDAIVRVEAHRLRKRLAEFYAGRGSGCPVEIQIPPGQYCPQFVVRQAHRSRLAVTGAQPAIA